MDKPGFERLYGLLGEAGPTLPDTEPPDSLWGRIEAEADVEIVGAGSIVEYSVGADDTLLATGSDWERFALDNDAPEMVDPDPSRTLWSYIADDRARDLWQLVVSRVRSTRSAATVPFRCDAPDTRRWFEMTVTPAAAGRVDFRSVLLFEERRPDVALMDRSTERDGSAPMVRVCCWCGRGDDGSGWVSVDELVYRNRMLEQPPAPEVEHVICDNCVRQMTAEADRLSTGP